MRILIVGGGIAGLTLAALLRQRGMDPLIIEKRTSGQQDGYVIGLRPQGNRVLKGLGLYGRLEESSTPLEAFAIADHRGREARSYDMSQNAVEFGPVLMVQRGTLMALLQSAVPADRMRVGVSLDRLEQSEDRVDVGFSDGTSGEFDLVIGCDGVHSQVRKLVFGDRGLRSTGWTGWGWWAEPGMIREPRMVEYWELGKRFCAIYPAQHVLCAVAGMPTAELGSAEGDASLERMREYLGDMTGLVPQALESIADNHGVFSGEFFSVRIDEWHRGRVALVGDAATAFFPFGGLGLGGSLAIQSAAVLADELTRTDRRFVSQALGYYEARRRPHMEAYERAAQSVVELTLTPATPARTVDDLLTLQETMFQEFQRLRRSPI